MARKRDEHRMVFDIRGRRKHVVKFVYAVLALLMGASLFLVVGPAPLSDLFGGGSSSTSAASQFEEQSERFEKKLKKDPQNPDLLLGLTRAQINAGNSLVTVDPETGAAEFTIESRTQLEEASESWAKYLKATDEPSSGAAQQVAQAQFTLAETSRTNSEAEANVRAAADAQELVAKARPSLGSLSTLAIYRYYSFDFEGGDQARAEAAKHANTKFEREELENELDKVEKRGHEFQKASVEAEKAAKKAAKGKKPSLAAPLSESNPFASP
jgi:hypothetical protein